MFWQKSQQYALYVDFFQTFGNLKKNNIMKQINIWLHKDLAQFAVKLSSKCLPQFSLSKYVLALVCPVWLSVLGLGPRILDRSLTFYRPAFGHNIEFNSSPSLGKIIWKAAIKSPQ